MKSKFPLGQLLIEKKIITPEQLDIALIKQKETGELLGVVLMELGFVDEETVFLPILAGQFGVDYASLKSLGIPKDVIVKVPAKFAIHYKIMPVEMKGNALVIATSKPLDVNLLDELSLALQQSLVPVLASEKEIMEAIRKYYGVGAETIDQMMTTVDSATQSIGDISNIEDIESEASISKFLSQILLEAYRDRASDIHIEPFENELKIRYRIDGVLYDAKVPPNIKHFKDSINSRIKILSNLNIAEKRTPQDGRFKVKVGEIDLDLRVSFLPTPYGESVVLRILNATRLYDFDELGMTKDEQAILANLIQKPHGIVFVTGPTGSGKTTTLYASIARINTEDKKIITIEDPVEYQIKGITQIQINPSVGLTFAKGLRSMLRHDPDVMMVGEVRDIETAEIAIQVALTGHLVFSTLHTNDAASGAARLLDMGVDPYLVASTVECFIAQRLIRLICPKCREAGKISAEIIQKLKGKVETQSDTVVFAGKGCERCNFTGYAGRQSIYEFLVVTEDVRQLIMRRASANEIKQKAMEQGMRTLGQSGWDKVKLGLTTPQEIIRVTQEEE